MLQVDALGAFIGVIYYLVDKGRDKVEGLAYLREVPQDVRHVVVVFDAVQTHPGQGVPSGDEVLVIRLVHVPEEGYVERTRPHQLLVLILVDCLAFLYEALLPGKPLYVLRVGLEGVHPGLQLLIGALYTGYLGLDGRPLPAQLHVPEQAHLAQEKAQEEVKKDAERNRGPGGPHPLPRLLPPPGANIPGHITSKTVLFFYEKEKYQKKTNTTNIIRAE